MLKTNVILHVHDPIEDRGETQFLNFIQSKVLSFVCVSGFIAKSLVTNGIPAPKVSVIYNGVDVSGDILRAYMPQGKLRIGMVGQIRPRKAHHHVFAACNIIKDKIPFEVNIYGDGPNDYISELKQLAQQYGIEGNIFWKGFETDKAALYNNIDVLLAPTTNDEPFALVALEAGMYQVPVIATISGGFPESIVHNETGFLVEKNNPDAIAGHLIQLYREEDMLRRIGKKAREHIKAHFTTGIFESNIKKLIETIASQKL